jgi:CRP-like cAMP-binding protein|tara:strand:+ start:8195 stop:8950 length:756 start_codon:yes stop_codon:yes gene_type:complete
MVAVVHSKGEVMEAHLEHTSLARLDESLLTHIPPFSLLHHDQIREIIDQATVRRYVEGTAVFREGDPAYRFFMVLDGYIRVLRVTPGGEQVISLHIPSGQLFGFAKAIGRDTYPATAMTASEAIILSWPMQVWDYFVTSYPGFSSETYKIVGERMGELNMRVVEMATQQVEQRVANTLLRLVNQTGRKVEGGIEVDFSITRQDLSEMTATTLHTISRLLSAWEKQGLVKSRRKHIVVSNPQRLVVLGQDHG